MENNINKTIHIEFYGLPGCGKSTISHALALYLKENNFCVEEPTYEIDHCNNKTIRRIKKILQYILFYFKENKLYRKLKSSIKENEYLQPMLVYKNLINIIPKVIKYNSSKNKIYIWDEGLIQSSISASLYGKKNANYNEKNFLELINIQENLIIYVYIKEDIEIILKRLNYRKSTDSRVEKENNTDKRIKMLKKILAECNLITNKRKICVSSNIDIIQLNELIKNTLKGSFQEENK